MEGGTAFWYDSYDYPCCSDSLPCTCTSKSWTVKSDTGVWFRSFGNKLFWIVSSLVWLSPCPAAVIPEGSAHHFTKGFSCPVVQTKALTASCFLQRCILLSFLGKKFRIFLIALMPALKNFKQCYLGSSITLVLTLSAMWVVSSLSDFWKMLSRLQYEILLVYSML